MEQTEEKREKKHAAAAAAATTAKKYDYSDAFAIMWQFVCLFVEHKTRLSNYDSLENADNLNGMAKYGCNSFKLNTKNKNGNEFKW